MKKYILPVLLVLALVLVWYDPTKKLGPYVMLLFLYALVFSWCSTDCIKTELRVADYGLILLGITGVLFAGAIFKKPLPAKLLKTVLPIACLAFHEKTSEFAENPLKAFRNILDELVRIKELLFGCKPSEWLHSEIMALWNALSLFCFFIPLIIKLCLDFYNRKNQVYLFPYVTIPIYLLLLGVSLLACWRRTKLEEENPLVGLGLMLLAWFGNAILFFGTGEGISLQSFLLFLCCTAPMFLANNDFLLRNIDDEDDDLYPAEYESEDFEENPDEDYYDVSDIDA